jgi:hypothetical protein
MLNFIPRHQFDALENQYGTRRKACDFSRWNQFVHLMFMQLTGRSSLRDGIQSMNSRFKNLYHLWQSPLPDQLLQMPMPYGLLHFTKRYLKGSTNVTG